MTDSHPSQAVGSAETADVIVVGAGPGGSATAAYLAMAGLDVLLLEKAHFPRDKICGDGLTPRAVRELAQLGVPTAEEDGWIRNKGLRIVGGGRRFELDWPETDYFPPYGMVRKRQELDEILARYAAERGARLLEGVNVQEAIREESSGRIQGVTAKVMGRDGRATGETVSFRAPVVVAADGVSSRLSMAMGRPKRDDRPMGVAVRTYYESPVRTNDEYMESWLELWVPEDEGSRGLSGAGAAGKDILLPGYGWIFACGDGTANVGLGMLDTSPAFGRVDYRDVMRRWVATLPAEWSFTEETAVQPIRGAALPMAFNRQPLYADGLLLVGDAGGMVNPFNGEGIDYAMEAGRTAAEIIVQAMARADDAGRERVLMSYNSVMKEHLGGYYSLGRGFAALIGKPEVMRLCVKYGLPITPLMRVLLKTMANLAQPRGGGIDDRLITALSRIAPSA
ncbi:geranylgeranyl reductase family [Austwickia chelonae]|uniref:Putative geranylgeranyl reductase n=1 Tax=Austwickia chelonae NBRC 105200 TaxID=1184607 RepID=K6UME3_9MICO|nr:geranylgeranyl reductase family protein [Austwickia chelonae]GAB78046.1 putative geranylgeranyl reductase [Austwickia chelonae NBRC 105200]SEV95090.1 geranylgeranyl reductase family [Austwickia chelonae]